MPIQVEVPGKGLVEFPDGTPPEVMEQALAEFREEAAPEHPHARVARLVGENLPAIGGAIGGLLGAAGGPGVAAGTAALGGAAGRAGQHVIGGLQKRPVPQGTDLAADLGTAGATQGAVQLVGGAMGGALAKGARRMYQGLAKPSKALRQEFPDVIDTAVKERIPLTQRGAQKVEQKLGASSAKAREVITQAEQAGAPPVQPREVVSAFPSVVKELRKRADIGQAPQFGAVGARGQRLMASHGRSGIPLSRAQELKQTAQTSAQGAYRAKDRGVAKELGAEDLLDEATAKGLRQAIERRVPDVAPINRQTQSLIGVDRMLTDALGREGNTLGVGGMRDLIAAGAGGGLGSAVGMPAEGVAAGLLLRLLSAPGTGSVGAIGLNELSKLPHAQLLRLLMASHDPEQ